MFNQIYEHPTRRLSLAADFSDYTEFQQFFAQRQVDPSSLKTIRDIALTDNISVGGVGDATSPAGNFSQFVKYFGVQVFSIWKHALLRKRILFYAAPPLESACHHGIH